MGLLRYQIKNFRLDVPESFTGKYIRVYIFISASPLVSNSTIFPCLVYIKPHARQTQLELEKILTIFWAQWQKIFKKNQKKKHQKRKDQKKECSSLQWTISPYFMIFYFSCCFIVLCEVISQQIKHIFNRFHSGFNVLKNQSNQ